MKLKILPPSLREKKRYIAFEVISEEPLSRDDLISLIWKSSLAFCGESQTSKFNIWVMKVWKYQLEEHENVLRGILKCTREEVNPVRATMSIIAKFKGKRVVFHTLGISGTIRSATKKFIKPKE
ncbi:MAG: ribonuclease P [Euryarchaeota archaeon]|nr:ribonuclease P [Euryarchaeota archaeon]